MAYNENLANRIREKLGNLSNVTEKQMMGGLTFMYNDKMCVGIIADEMMCRIDPILNDTAVEKLGCREMDFTKRPFKVYVMVDEFAIKTEKEFDYWINLCLAFNSKAKSSKKKSKSNNIKKNEKMKNAINWFEIPVTDFTRAKKFYEILYGAEIMEVPFPNGKYGMLPSDMENGVGGGIAQGEGFEPSTKGSIVYLNGGDDLSIPLSKVEAAGGKILMPKTSIDGNGFMAYILDTEGNKVALHSMK